MNHIKKLKELVDESKLDRTDLPSFISPMLATLTDNYFNDKHWIYERKLDGERAILIVKKGEVKLFSRNEKALINRYPELEKAAANLSEHNFIADGEIVAFDGNLSSFSKLQNRTHIKDREEAKEAKPKVYLYLFDLIYFGGYDLSNAPLRNRKKTLLNLLSFEGRIKYTPHRNEKGKSYYQESCKKGWEGIIAKDAQSTYVKSRSKKWLKFKCTARQELVIGGFTEPQGERKGFGALLMGYYENNKLKYAGKVGTGYDDQFLEKWRKKLDEIELESTPFENFDEEDENDIHWVTPKYVGEIGFTEWTDDNKLRHPKFKGMRKDKKAKNVVKE